VCMLLYLNKDWHNNGGELVFIGVDDKPVSIAPLYNRCVLFNPASPGSEHWVKALTTEENTQQYRYNVTSWYWSE
jgi:SM-20-related protein